MTRNQGMERILIVEDEVLLAKQVKKNRWAFEKYYLKITRGVSNGVIGWGDRVGWSGGVIRWGDQVGWSGGVIGWGDPMGWSLEEQERQS